MPRTRCGCGAVLDDDDEETTQVHLVFSEQEWNQREAEPDWRKRKPFTFEAWQCKSCGRWYLYQPDEDEPEMVLIPESKR